MLGQGAGLAGRLGRRRRRRDDGAWESDLGSQAVTATIALDAPGRRLLRRRSSDGNDGEYRIQQGLAFEAFDRCTLVGGIQKLHGSIPRPWHCLAWNWPLTDGH